MAVLSREEFFSRVSGIVGTSSSDNDISFVEDMTDTYNSLSTKATGDGENWKQKYEDLDAAWRARYQKRFFTGNGENVNIDEYSPRRKEERKITESNIMPEDLFK